MPGKARRLANVNATKRFVAIEPRLHVDSDSSHG
jgi:hypothetical protein